MLGALLPTSLYAQHAYRPLVVDGKDWVSVYLRQTDIIHFEDGEIVGSDRTEDYGEMHEVLEGDTVINGYTYKKVQTTTPYRSYCSYALREEDRKVYAYVFNPMAQEKKSGHCSRVSNLLQLQSQLPLMTSTTSAVAGYKVHPRMECMYIMGKYMW